MEFKMIHDYKHNALYRESFNALAKKIFWISFERWYELDFWNDRYICFSFIDKDQIIANVSANLLSWVVQGKQLNVIQIGTVMTHPDYRKKGLASQLMQHILKTYEEQCDLFYLFGEPTVKGFYESFGFIPIQETCYHTELVVNGKSPSFVRKLNLSEPGDMDIIRRLTAERAPLSDQFWVGNTSSLLAWHLLNVYPDEIYYIEQLDAIVLFKVEGEVINLYDIVCRNHVPLEEVIEYLVPDGKYKVKFHYTPAKPSSYSREPFVTDDYIFFVKAKDEKMLPAEFFHPVTAHA
ncbi:MAG: GNAT family N-acetyltransferase [Thermoclostridium sp.]|nr:GNAT family N-acetyltransferase [Thermoclostridium sp.]